MREAEGLTLPLSQICCDWFDAVIQGKIDFLFERRLNDYLAGVISEYSKGKPTLVFCR